MDASLRPLFDAILDAPEDDAPRLALAARLTELGDARGEHAGERVARSVRVARLHRVSRH